MILSINYMSGAGNLFAVIDNRSYSISAESYSELAPTLCSISSTDGIHTEGLIIINNSDELDFDVWFFNPDGSHSMMCGNGGRCSVRFAINNGFFKKDATDTIEFSMAGSKYRATLNNANIKLQFPPPDQINEFYELIINNLKLTGTYINVGSDHFVLNVDDNDLLNNTGFYDFDLLAIAPQIRKHSYFSPKGVNVNIYHIENDNTILLRTFERGVEAETGACGTGAIATAISAYLEKNISFPVTIIPTSKSFLIIDAVIDNNDFQSLTLEGPAEYIGKTTLEINIK